MMIDLFDAQCSILGRVPGRRDAVSADALRAEMDRLQIGRALVRIAPADFETDVPLSNAKLYAACGGASEKVSDTFSPKRENVSDTAPPQIPAAPVCGGDGRLVPCPVVVPAVAGDLPAESEQAADAVARGAGAAWIRPAADHWRAAEWLSEPLFAALAERRLPVYVAWDDLPVEQVAAVAGRFGDLPILLAGLPFREQRTLLALGERFANIHLCLGNPYALYGGVRQLAERLGPGRLLFGTGFPAAEPMAAVTLLMYADLDEPAKRRIGSENLAALWEGIRR